jgi:hypothetical protein
MSRFIAVVHGWHVESKGFDVHELEATDLEQAEKEAAWIKAKRESTFDRCAVAVIEIDDIEYLPRSLTWRERLTGRTAP